MNDRAPNEIIWETATGSSPLLGGMVFLQTRQMTAAEATDAPMKHRVIGTRVASLATARAMTPATYSAPFRILSMLNAANCWRPCRTDNPYIWDRPEVVRARLTPATQAYPVGLRG